MKVSFSAAFLSDEGTADAPKDRAGHFRLQRQYRHTGMRGGQSVDFAADMHGKSEQFRSVLCVVSIDKRVLIVLK